MNAHLHMLRTPLGRVMYTHYDVDELVDGTDRFVGDGYLVPRDGSPPRLLPRSALLHLIRTLGTGERVRLERAPPPS